MGILKNQVMSMDQETAQVLFREGATFILLDMPEGSEFGIDYNSWTVGHKFRGVKMIPPGIHFIYYSSCSKSGSTGPRTGFFYDFKQREILLRKWDKYNEDVQTEDVAEDEMERVTSNMKELDQFLGPYPYDSYKKWVSMTSCITGDLLSQLHPACGRITSVTQFKSEMSNSKMRLDKAASEAEQKLQDGESDTQKSETSLLPTLETIPGTEINFSPIPKKRYPEGATPGEITRHSMDSSFLLSTMLESFYSSCEKGILGEIQFSFICFLIGQVYDAFDQWKRLVHLLCTCEDALDDHSELFMNFITVLHFQVHEIPEDFFVDIVSSNNFLTTTLQQLFSTLEERSQGDKLRQRGLKFREHLTRKFKWDFTQEPDDYDPVVVETDT